MKNFLVERGAVLAMACSFLLPIPGNGQGVVPLGTDTLRLEEVVRSVLTGNEALAAARANSMRQQAVGRTIASLPEPRLAITYQPESIVTARGAQRSQFRLEQMIPIPGTRSRQRAIEDLGTGIAQAATSTLEADLVLAGKNAYYDLHRTELLNRLIEGFEEQLRRFEDAALTQYSVGTGMQQAVLKAQLERARLSQVRLQLDADRDDAVARLSEVMGSDLPSDVATLAAIDRPDPQRWESADLAALALATRSEISVLKSESKQASTRSELAGRMRYPAIGVSATYFDIATSDIVPNGDGKDAVALGAVIRLPLNRRSYRAEMDAAQLHRSNVDSRRADLEQRIVSQIKGLTGRLRSYQQQLTLIEEGLVPRAETTLQVTLSDYTNGRAGFLDLLDAERTLYNLRSTEIETHIVFLKSVGQLERTLGVVKLAEIEILNHGGEEND